MSFGIRRRELLFLSSNAALAALAGCTKDSTSWEAHIANLEKRVPQVMAETKTPGLSIAIIRSAKLTWLRSFGVKDRASNAPVDDRTIFEAASMSKPVFAYAVMKLCERGILDLDTPLTKYTSERFLLGDPRLDLITARHLLSHTSGFTTMRSGAEPLKIQSPPGKKWNYSGEGYAYLQSVVTKLTGRVDRRYCGRYEADLEVCATNFGEYMKANLLEPLGMTLSSYLHSDRTQEQMARPHDTNGQPLDRKQRPGIDLERANVARYGAMGALLTTATDYAKFLIELMEPKPADAFRLSPAGITEMFRPQVKVEEGEGYSISWALGWRVAHVPGGDLIGHGGDQTGFHSTSEISVPNKSGFVILTNGDNGWKLIKELAPEMSRWTNRRNVA